VRDIVDGSSKKDIQEASAYSEGKNLTTIPKLFDKLQVQIFILSQSTASHALSMPES